jgi:hemolysin III
VGTYFYLNRRIPYAHAIWHLFVLGGSVCHFVAVLSQVLPSGAS